MTKPYVLFATPSFERRPCIEYVVSMCQTQCAMTNAKIDHVTMLLGGDPYLAKVRNRLISTFLNEHPKATDLFFLDDDIGWPVHKVMEFLERPEDVICGIYPKKQDALEFPVTLQLDANDQFIEHNGLLAGKLVPTGFMRIKRHVLEQMAARSLKYQEVVAGGKTHIFWEVFQCRLVDQKMEDLRRADLDSLSREDAIAHLKRGLGLIPAQELCEWWGEDYFFAERWREMGGQIWVDPDIQFTHRGSKAFEANFMHTIRRTREAQAQAAAQAAQKEAA